VAADFPRIADRREVTVSGVGSPIDFSEVIPFTVGDHIVNGGSAVVNIGIVADPSTPQSEWASWRSSRHRSLWA
jgi:hypothetical protein